MCCGRLRPWDTTLVSLIDCWLTGVMCTTCPFLFDGQAQCVACKQPRLTCLTSTAICWNAQLASPDLHAQHKHCHMLCPICLCACEQSMFQVSGLCIAGDDVLAAAATHVHSILHQFNQQNLALTLWAFAKLAWCPPTDLLSDAASLAVASLHTSNSQNLSNTLWAFATLGFMPQAGLLEVCCRTLQPGFEISCRLRQEHTMVLVSKLEQTSRLLSDMSWHASRMGVIFPAMMTPMACYVNFPVALCIVVFALQSIHIICLFDACTT